MELLNGTNYVGGVVSSIESGDEKSISNCYNKGNVIANQYVGGVIGYNKATSLNVENCAYLTGTADKGIGTSSDTTAEITSNDTLPDVLTVINGDNAFMADDGRNGGYPILAWQK